MRTCEMIKIAMKKNLLYLRGEKAVRYNSIISNKVAVATPVKKAAVIPGKMAADMSAKKIVALGKAAVICGKKEAALGKAARATTGYKGNTTQAKQAKNSKNAKKADSDEKDDKDRKMMWMRMNLHQK
ncbi:hypothetical protein P7K49_039119 [Saguinus oedipus]|uniref:Uncharacterized protein n=1 Tax=Saguinus oedipus TaxID=9490 RepID=A0ABQ9TGK7_SAGOE|nr:hypothetical protein P7K49_039119 [Saguinus oedipus]